MHDKPHEIEAEAPAFRGAFSIVIVVCVLGYLTTYDYDGWNIGTVVHVAAWVAICSLCGLWVGLGNFLWRIPIVIAAAILTSLFSNGFAAADLMLYLFFAFGLIFVVGGSSFLLRLFYGELQQLDVLVTESEALQFNVRDLMVWTASIAAILAVGKWLIASPGHSGLHGASLVCGLLSTLVVANIVAIWAFLGDRISVTRVISFVVVLVAVSFLNNAIVSPNGFWLLATPASQLPVVAAIYCLRRQNYRFVKSSASAC